MFAPGTILRLREPQSTEEKPYPYDLIEVVGQSPVQHATSSESPWAGPDAVGFVVKPAGTFAPTVDKPLGELNELYEIERYPLDSTTGEPLKPENLPQNVPTPNQILAQASADHYAAQADKQKSRKKAPSLQANAKSPEQVLNEAAQKERDAREG